MKESENGRGAVVCAGAAVVWFAPVGTGGGFPTGVCAARAAVALGESAIPVGAVLGLGLGEPSALGERAVDVGEPTAPLCRAVAAVGLVAGAEQAALMVATAATVPVAARSIAEGLWRDFGIARHSLAGERQGTRP